MTNLFISHTKENAACVEQLRQELEARDYLVWREPTGITPQSPQYILKYGILSSAAIVVVWSSSAAQSEWVTLHLLVAQSLKKPLFFVLLDSTLLPDTLYTVQSIQGLPSCAGISTQLVPLLPPPRSTDTLIGLSEQAAHEFIRNRRAAIATAAGMLKKNEYPQEVLALLGFLANNDESINVRKEAQAVIDANAKKAQPWYTDDAKHIFSVKCKNGHFSYFDKRVVCIAARSVPRGTQESPQDELHLTCKTCKVEVVDYQDCRGYK